MEKYAPLRNILDRSTVVRFLIGIFLIIVATLLGRA